jgi:hypothetical protein
LELDAVEAEEAEEADDDATDGDAGGGSGPPPPVPMKREKSCDNTKGWPRSLLEDDMFEINVVLVPSTYCGCAD